MIMKSMEKYFDQLIEDFREIRSKPIPRDDLSKQQEFMDEYCEDPGYDEECIHGEQRPLEEIVGIPKANIPPHECLNKEAFDRLVPEMILLLNHFNIYPEFPEGVPNDMKYFHLREKWDRKCVFLAADNEYISFCEHDLETCPFEDYCDDCYDFIIDDFDEDEEYDDVFEEELKTDSHDKKPFEIDVKKLLPTKEQVEENYRLNRKERIKSYLKKPKSNSHISGIHNYCDRWCEKCTFTSRCTNFAMHQELFNKRPYLDVDNKIFWEELSILMEACSELISESANKHDIDIENIPLEDMPSDEVKHPLSKLAVIYTKKSAEFIKNTNNSFKNPDTTKGIKVNEAMEVIAWYSTVIPAKLSRAVNGLTKNDDNASSNPDMNGSAKVALIGIDRSTSALCLVFKESIKNRDEVIDLLSHLSKIKEGIEKLFPSAWDFKRPGFDE